MALCRILQEETKPNLGQTDEEYGNVSKQI